MVDDQSEEILQGKLRHVTYAGKGGEDRRMERAMEGGNEGGRESGREES